MPDQICDSLDDVARFTPDLIVEVSHPSITKAYGASFLACADFMLGSPTALADPEVEAMVQEALKSSEHGLYVPAGALWGAAVRAVHDIQQQN